MTTRTKGKKFILQNVLLTDGWKQNVGVEIDEQGYIRDIVHNSTASFGEIVSGFTIPGIANLHSHAHQRAMAGLAERSGNNQSPNSDSFWYWREIMYRFLKLIDPDDIHAIASMLYLEMLKHGFTCVGEFQYLHHDFDGQHYQDKAIITKKCLSAALEVGIGFTALPVLYHDSGFGGKPATDLQSRFINDADNFMDIVTALNDLCSEHHNCSMGIAPHSLRAVNQPLLTQIIQACNEIKINTIHIHIAEQMKEVQDCIEWSKQRPVEWLLNHFDIDENWCLIHATHMNSTEATNLAKSGAIVGLCPTTEANLGDGIFNAEQFTQGHWGIGSDSHVSISPVEELRWLEYGQRLIRQRRNVFTDKDSPNTARTLLDMAITYGAKACNRQSGEITIGKLADFIVLDDQHPRTFLRSENELLDSWIFSGNDNLVKDVYVCGNKVIDNKQHKFEDKIISEFKKTISKLGNDL